MENTVLILETQLSSDNVLICYGNYTVLRYHSRMAQSLSGYRHTAIRCWTLAWPSNAHVLSLISTNVLKYDFEAWVFPFVIILNFYSASFHMKTILYFSLLYYCSPQCSKSYF